MLGKIELGNYVFYSKDEDNNLWQITGIVRKGNGEIVHMTIADARGAIAKVSLDEITAVLEDVENGFNAIPTLKVPEERVDKVAKNNYFDSHYAARDVQTIEIIQAALPHKEFVGWLKGQVLRYRDRAGTKPGEPYEKDDSKMKRYLQWLEQAQQGKKINPREN